MLIIGLTGGVASGKNFVADQFEKLNIPVFDADREVHHLFLSDRETFKQIQESFPDATIGDNIDRQKLGDLTLKNKEKLNILEKVIHPKVRNRQNEFIKKNKALEHKLAILNIPLLFEKGGHKICDKIITITVPKEIQEQRFLNRMKAQNPDTDIDSAKKRLEYIRQNQSSDAKKETLADFIIDNSKDKNYTIEQIHKIINQLTKS